MFWHCGTLMERLFWAYYNVSVQNLGFGLHTDEEIFNDCSGSIT